MQKEDIMALAHLLSSMKEAIDSLEESIKEKNMDRILVSKSEVLRLQEQMNKIL